MTSSIQSCDFDISNVNIPPPTTRTYTVGNGQGGKYTEARIAYKHGGGFEGSLKIVFPVTSGRRPINVPENTDFKNSLHVSLEGPHAEDYLTVFNSLHEKCLDWAVENAGKLGAIGSKIKTRETADVVFTSPIFQHKPSEDGTPRPASKYTDFIYSQDGKISTDIRIIDGSDEGQPVPFEFLIGKSFEFVPTIWIQRVYVGSKPKLHCKVVKLIVCKINEVVHSAVESGIMKKLYAERAGDASEMAKMFAQFKPAVTQCLEIPTITEPSTISQVDTQIDEPVQEDGDDDVKPPTPPPVATTRRNFLRKKE